MGYKKLPCIDQQGGRGKDKALRSPGVVLKDIGNDTGMLK
jgi:hypothetical protein